MKVAEQTLQKIERALRKAAAKFPANEETLPLTAITRCDVEEWIGNTGEHFYEDVQDILHQVIASCKEVTENFNLLKPYSFVLTGEDHETIADLYLLMMKLFLLTAN